MDKINMKKIIYDLVILKRREVINALILSDVTVYSNISPIQLYRLVMSELKKDNVQFIERLGVIIDDVFGFNDESLSNVEGVGGTQNTWWSDNKDKVLSTGISTGLSLLNNYLNKPPSTNTSTGTQPSNTLAAMQSNLALQTQQANIAAQQASQAAKNRNTIIIVSVIGGLVLVGGITAIVLTRK